MNWFKIAAVAAGIAAGAAGIAKVVIDKKKKNIDDYLLPAPNDTESEEIPALKSDILSWVGMDEKVFPATLSFALADDQMADAFQEALAKDGISSSYDSASNIVDVIYNGETSIDSLTFLAASLINAVKQTDAQYQGFVFSK